MGEINKYNATGYTIEVRRKVWSYGFFIIFICSFAFSIGFALNGLLSLMIQSIFGIILGGIGFVGMMDIQKNVTKN